jgi:hypothetical protein
MKSTNENDGQHIFSQSKSPKSNKRMMAGTITGERQKVKAKERPKYAHPTSHQYLKQLHLCMFNKFRMKKSQNMPIWLIKMVLTQHYYTGY